MGNFLYYLLGLIGGLCLIVSPVALLIFVWTLKLLPLQLAATTFLIGDGIGRLLSDFNETIEDEQ